MAIFYARDDDRRLITVMADGPFDVDGILGTLDRQATEGTWQYARLYDDRRVTVPPTSEQTRSLLDAVRRRIREHGPRGPVAIVTDQPANYGMVRMYMTLADEEQFVAVFRESSDAERWLAARGHGPAAV